MRAAMGQVLFGHPGSFSTSSSVQRRSRTVIGPRSSDLVQLAAFNEPDELVPFGVRQADGVFPFADRDGLVVISTSGQAVQAGHNVNFFGSIGYLLDPTPGARDLVQRLG